MILLLLSLLHIITCIVYTVIPDDHYYINTTCNHCHNLQYYLHNIYINIIKYFTSNTQLFFLPGLHHLSTDLIIQNVHNISLLGGTANGTKLNTIIQCNSSVGIMMNNISNLSMKNFIIRACQLLHMKTYNGLILSYTVTIKRYFSSVIIMKDCKDASVHHLQVYLENPNIRDPVSYDSLKGINILGNSNFSHISCLQMSFQYDKNDTKVENKHQNLFIDHYRLTQYKDYSSKYCMLYLSQLLTA